MKKLNLNFEDKAFKRLEERKKETDLSWEDFILKLIHDWDGYR